MTEVSLSWCNWCGRRIHSKGGSVCHCCLHTKLTKNSTDEHGICYVGHDGPQDNGDDEENDGEDGTKVRVQ